MSNSVGVAPSSHTSSIKDLKTLYESNEKFKLSERVQYKNNDETAWSNVKISDVYDPSYGIKIDNTDTIQNINKSNLRYLFEIGQKVIVRTKSEVSDADYTYSRTTVSGSGEDMTIDDLKYTINNNDGVSVYNMVPDREKPVRPDEVSTSGTEVPSTPGPTVLECVIEGMGMYLTNVVMKSDGTFESVGADSYMQETNGKKYKLVVNEHGKFDKIEIVSKVSTLEPTSVEQLKQGGGIARYRTIQKRYQPKNKTRKFKYLRRYLV